MTEVNDQLLQMVDLEDKLLIKTPSMQRKHSATREHRRASRRTSRCLLVGAAPIDRPPLIISRWLWWRKYSLETKAPRSGCNEPLSFYCVTNSREEKKQTKIVLLNSSKWLWCFKDAVKGWKKKKKRHGDFGVETDKRLKRSIRMNNDRVSTIKDQGLLNKQRITFIKKGLKNKVETQSGTKTTFSLETLLLCWLPQTNPATVVLMSWRISPEPSRSPAAADTDPQRAPGGESRASSLGLPVWRCFLPPFSSRRKDRETFSGPVERKEKPTLVKKKIALLGWVCVSLSLFFFKWLFVFTFFTFFDFHAASDCKPLCCHECCIRLVLFFVFDGPGGQIKIFNQALWTQRDLLNSYFLLILPALESPSIRAATVNRRNRLRWWQKFINVKTDVSINPFIVMVTG